MILSDHKPSSVWQTLPVPVLNCAKYSTNATVGTSLRSNHLSRPALARRLKRWGVSDRTGPVNPEISHPTLRQMGFAITLRLHGGTPPGRDRSLAGRQGFSPLANIIVGWSSANCCPIWNEVSNNILRTLREAARVAIIVSVALSIPGVYGAGLLPLGAIMPEGRSDFPLVFKVHRRLGHRVPKPAITH